MTTADPDLSTPDLSDPIWTIRHVAAALDGLSVDAAREHTYRTDFPAAKAPFAANLWLREDVLAWFAALPGKTRTTASAGSASAAARRSTTGPGSPRRPRRPAPTPGAESAPAAGPDPRGGIGPASFPASAGAGRWSWPEALRPAAAGMTGPIESYGAIRIYPPTGRGKNGRYYNLRWDRVDGTRGKTTGGTSLEQARWKAHQVDTYESSAAGPLAVTRLDALVAAYLAEGRSPYGRKRPWKATYRAQTEDQLRRSIRGFGHYRAMDVTRELVDRMRAQGGTPRMVQQNTTAWRGLLKWGYARKEPYFTAAQSELLPQGAVNPLPALLGTEMPERRDRARRVGEHAGYVRPEDAPSAPQVAALGRALASRFPTWGRLAPELAANSGPRWGEQFQLSADDVHPDGCPVYAAPHAHIDWQIDGGAAAGANRRTLPKGDKTRIAPVPTLSFTGYPLLQALRDRLAAAHAEQAAGTNPQALLFPAARGGLLWHTGWESDHLLPAMREAGWPLATWTEHRAVWCPETETYTAIARERTMAELTWHSLRHRFARIAIDTYGCGPGELMALGGWENEGTVQNRYYKSGEEHTLRGLALFSAVTG